MNKELQHLGIKSRGIANENGICDSIGKVRPEHPLQALASNL
jgi:hypothetical protein